ncbi:hypothetical protein Tco_1042639 [Tanacetum coccineum]|uniref:Uncharacterized protein n=1 Tax=Tanacetum coccineum TaxID=301880 RepID=A0ABQ5GKR3_9ASTR
MEVKDRRSWTSTLEILTEDIQCDISYLYVSRMAQEDSNPQAPACLRMHQETSFDSVSAALEVQAATMADAENTNRDTGPRETPVARKCSYKEFIRSPTFSILKVRKAPVGLIAGLN